MIKEEKLKTLKDLEIPFGKQFEQDSSERLLIWSDILRKSAIEDIKELKKTRHYWTGAEKPNKLEEKFGDVEPIIEYIKKKFNLTEEEIK